MAESIELNHESVVRKVEVMAGSPCQISHPVTARILIRIGGLMERINERLPMPDRPWQRFEKLDTPDRRRNFILAAANIFPDEVLKLTNLVTERPPDDVHRMQRSEPYWVGDFFSANMIVHALQKCGLERPEQTILDIGCSSGSLLRVLAAYEPNWNLHGRDPISSAISWAEVNVPTAQFGKMENDPPLDIESNSLDGVTAISVWSHHRPDAAERWGVEIARVLRPGGWFAVTFLSLHHARWLAKNDRMPAHKIAEMIRSLSRTGNHFVPVAYQAEDNNTSDNWGHSTFAREYFFDMFADRFDIVGYFPGLNQGNQDLAILAKRGGSG